MPGQFNHVIVYLPDYNVYVNPTNPYARSTRSTAGSPVRRSLSPASTGAWRARRRPAPEENRYRMESRVRILPDGTLDGSATLATSANLDSGMRNAVASAASTRELAERLLSNTAEGGFGEFKTSDPRDLTTPLSIAATWTSPHGITFQGRKAYMPVPTGPDLRPPHLLRVFFSATGERRHAMLVGAGEYSWTTDIYPPPDTLITAVPPNVDVQNGAGRYTATYEQINGGLRVTRDLTIDQDVYPASDYASLQALLYAPIDDARAVVVLTRQTETTASQ